MKAVLFATRPLAVDAVVVDGDARGPPPSPHQELPPPTSPAKAEATAVHGQW
jgi:hypothetical protein